MAHPQAAQTGVPLRDFPSALFTAEELGLVGSERFAKKWPLDRRSTYAVNLDMVGCGRTLYYVRGELGLSAAAHRPPSERAPPKGLSRHQREMVLARQERFLFPPGRGHTRLLPGGRGGQMLRPGLSYRAGHGGPRLRRGAGACGERGGGAGSIAGRGLGQDSGGLTGFAGRWT
ncbi:MAG TPA: M28 family peptidase [Anaerolineae bacterium]|nr:M28 family peptidase [Anaerolineae bacterium]